RRCATDAATPPPSSTSAARSASASRPTRRRSPPPTWPPSSPTRSRSAIAPSSTTRKRRRASASTTRRAPAPPPSRPTSTASIAPALGLSPLAARDTPVGTLFIAEGFGMLDPAALELTLAALDALQARGRQVGVISHVPGLAERIGAQVRIVPQGGGRSRVIV